jgi:hypothetical protein
MIESQEQELMIKFLKKNFPVYRLKHDMRFKRTIVLETGESYLLSNKDSVNDLYFKLSDILKTVFNTDKNTNKSVLDIFLNLK